MPATVDVLLLAVADVTRDARTINLARALAKDGVTVGIVGAGKQLHSTVASEDSNIAFFEWSDPGGRALRRWWSFNRCAATLDVRARCVAAMDLFALSASRSIARRCKAHLLYDMREFYFALGPLQGKGLRQRILAAHESRLVGNVDDVIVSGELDANIAQKRFALAKRPVVLLNTPPYKDVVPSSLETVVTRNSHQSTSLSQKTLVLYQGVVHHGRGLAPFMNAMAVMPMVQLVVIGDGPARHDLQALAERLGVAHRVAWIGSVPYDELHQLTCGAHVGLCLIEPISMSYEYALPNKLFEYMMARVPSLVTDLPALHEHIIRHPVGVLVDPALTIDNIVLAMERVIHAETYTAMKHACEEIRNLSYERQARTAVALFREHL